MHELFELLEPAHARAVQHLFGDDFNAYLQAGELVLGSHELAVLAGFEYYWSYLVPILQFAALVYLFQILVGIVIELYYKLLLFMVVVGLLVVLPVVVVVPVLLWLVIVDVAACLCRTGPVDCELLPASASLLRLVGTEELFIVGLDAVERVLVLPDVEVGVTRPARLDLILLALRWLVFQ